MTNNASKEERQFLSTREVANLLGISRVAVFKRIKKGEIKAQKVGRNYIIRAEDVSRVFNRPLDEKTKQQLNSSVDKVIQDYGETIKRLGDE